jgi:hypothetical protein
MVVSQQISPSALRSYKLSKYTNGQPGKMLLEAKRVKRVTSQFMTKSGAKEAATKMKALKKTAATAKKVADATKKASDLATKVNEVLFKNVPGSAVLDKASRIGGILGILAAIGVVALLKLQEFISGRGFDDLLTTQLDLTKVNTTAINNGLKLKIIDAKIQKFEKELNANAKDYYQLNKQTDTIAKKANEALYETREGRKIVAGLAEAARKLANDALYEARQNKVSIEAKITEQRISFDAKIQAINATISKFNNSISDAFQKSVNSTISKIQSDLTATKAQVATIQPSTVNTSEISANAVAAAKAEVAGLKGIINQLTIQANGASAVASAAITGISNLAQGVSSANTTASQALNEARSKASPASLGTMQQQLDAKFADTVAQLAKDLKIRDLSQSALSKEFDQKLAEVERINKLSGDERYKAMIEDNRKTLGTVDLTLSKLSQDFDKRNADFFAQSTKTSQEIYEGFIEQNKQALGTIKSEVTVVKADIKTNTTNIAKIDTKLGEQAKVNEQALPKLDQILGILPLIPARAANAIRPDIPTIPQIEAAAATGTCRTTQPGGCMNKALKDNAADITNNNNTNAANILDAVNTGANAALLTGQQTILARLGDQLPGGIGGKLSRFADWMHLDRLLNLMTFAATVHNAAMLSNNLAQTLFSAIGNVLSAIGLKKEDGSAFDIGSVISSGIESLIKGMIGEENYKSLNSTWKKANRIYQAAANLLNSIQSLSASILSALEVVGQWNAKVANALKKFGVVGEKAYSWMNPNVNFQNKYFTALENATNVISQVDQVASEVLSIKETVGQIVEQKKELDDSLKETDTSKQKKDLPEAIKVAQKENESKAASAALPVSESDKEPDED